MRNAPRSFCTEWVAAAIAIMILLLPFVGVSFPPSTDLPQHLSQIQLLRDVLRGEAPELVIDWLGPNNLIYALLAAVETVLDPQEAGRAVLMLLVASWVTATMYVAHQRGRPWENAVLASLFTYNFCLYWGFLNFLIGWPVFLVFMVQLSRKPSGRRTLSLMILSLLLFAAHALWFLVGAAVLAAGSFLQRKGGRAILMDLAVLLPVGLLAAIWYPEMATARASAGFDTAPHWFTTPWSRLTPTWLLNAMLGGVRGPLEPAIALCVALWIAAALITYHQRRQATVDRALLSIAVLLLAIVLLAPDKYMNTIYFSARWLPCSVVLFLLALPAPRGNARILRVLLFGVLAAFALETRQAWLWFDRYEMSGLEESLQQLPADPRVLGLDFVKTSSRVKGRPFLQVFAYAQARKGGELNFSFAEHSSGIVRYRQERRKDWTPGLEWSAERASNRDLRRFDYAIVNARPGFHARIAQLDELEPVTDRGRWRLYRSTEPVTPRRDSQHRDSPPGGTSLITSRERGHDQHGAPILTR